MNWISSETGTNGDTNKEARKQMKSTIFTRCLFIQYCLIYLPALVSSTTSYCFISKKRIMTKNNASGPACACHKNFLYGSGNATALPQALALPLYTASKQRFLPNPFTLFGNKYVIEYRKTATTPRIACFIPEASLSAKYSRQY